MTRARSIGLLAAALFSVAFARDKADLWIDATRLPPLQLASSVQVLDRQGQLLRAYTVADGRWRLTTTANAVDPAFVAALLAYEDKRFYTHPGVDLRALARATLQALWNRRIISGGSTLTMQVARLLEEGSTGEITGKLRQMRVALALERRLTKEQILGLYLSFAPYGGNLEGIRAASLAYFGKEPRRLTPAEIALLVAIPQSPENRRPDRHHARATTARDRVLARAERDGLINADQAQAARTEKVPSIRRPFPALAPHLADRARCSDPARPSHSLTIDRRLQIALQNLAAETVAPLGDRLQIALVAADHQTGEILASVGSAAFEDGPRAGFVDMTQSLRSPGSTLKPLVYGLAFDEGLAHPETLLEDRPADFSGYRPQNFDRLYRGTIRARQALQLSLNIPVVTLTDALGPARLLTALDKAGVQYDLPPGQPGLAIALGGIGVTLQDMVQLYAGLARGGATLPLRWTLSATPTEGQRLMARTSAWYVGDILAGLAPPPGAPQNRLAYKTGTSYGHRDAWAIGYDGRHVIGVWLGRADGTPVPGVFGADLAAPVLFQAFARLKPALTPQPAPPSNALLLATSQLPQPLQQFRSRTAAFQETENAPSVSFPPDGAEVELLPEGLLVRVDAGLAPFTWLVNGAPYALGVSDRQLLLTGLAPGFANLTVIDAQGRSANSSFRLR